ncbi:hypothetical protein ACIA49_38850 [Kribbella sp. NPDC051587]|uniref:hypothetical protein n=1 Tax=Kribbella sp. NPDC051587 TaxID=3364119 RepID=UPI0037BC5E16
MDSIGTHDALLAAQGMHDHGALLGDQEGPGNRGVDSRLIAEFIGAAVDLCMVCHDLQLSLLAEDPVSAARTVEQACVAVNAVWGCLPESLVNEEVPGKTTLQFRRLAAAGCGGNNETMFALARAMTSADRRAALTSAGEILSVVLRDDLMP